MPKVIRAPSIFAREESDFYKYAAIIATTEPYKQGCIETIRENMNPLKYCWKKMLGKSCVYDMFPIIIMLTNTNTPIQYNTIL